MEVIAKGKHIKVSPKKARPVADLIRGKNANEAQITLSAMSKTAARNIKTVLESAMANAENNFNLEKKELVITKITVDKGPVAKRYMPRAQGRATEIKRQTSNIEIVISGDIKTKKKASVDAQTMTNKEDKEDKKVLETQEAKDDSKQIEMERPQDKMNINADKKGSLQKMFRRKTG